MSKHRTPPDSAELREAEEGFRRWLLPEGCSDLIDVQGQAAPEPRAEPTECIFCGASSVLHEEFEELPTGFIKASGICESCALLWRRAWDELKIEAEKFPQAWSKLSSEWSDAVAERIRRRVLELLAERKKMKN